MNVSLNPRVVGGKKGALQNVSPRCHCEPQLSSVCRLKSPWSSQRTNINQQVVWDDPEEQWRVKMLEKCPDAFNHHGIWAEVFPFYLFVVSCTLVFFFLLLLLLNTFESGGKGHSMCEILIFLRFFFSPFWYNTFCVIVTFLMGVVCRSDILRLNVSPEHRVILYGGKSGYKLNNIAEMQVSGLQWNGNRKLKIMLQFLIVMNFWLAEFWWI